MHTHVRPLLASVTVCAASHTTAAYKHAGSLPDILDRYLGLVAATVQSQQSASQTDTGISLFTPVQPMLASACRSIADLSEQLARLLKRSNGGGAGTDRHIDLQVEDKFDGERVQVHFDRTSGKPPAAYSRNMKAMITWKFDTVKDAVPAAFPNSNSLIVDGEILVVDKATGAQLPFGTLGVHKFAALPSTASVCILLFDILYLDGKSLLNKPLSERRALLSKVTKPVRHRIEVGGARVAKDWDTVEVQLMSDFELISC